MNQQCDGCPFAGTKIVPPQGLPSAPILLIGEAPGEHEVATGVPFSGPSGDKLNYHLKRAGIDRAASCRVDNVLQCHPPGNKINTPDARRALEHCIPKFWERLRLCKPSVIVPMGNTALSALGIRDPIGKSRGFITKTSFGKVIPTWHPAALFRAPEEEVTATYDWTKIKRHSLTDAMPARLEHFQLFPKIRDVELFCTALNARAAMGVPVVIGVDVETFMADHPMNAPLKLIGIADSPTNALVVPLITEAGSEYWSVTDAYRAILAVGGVLENPKITKVMHHALFDSTVLMNHGFLLRGSVFDTMLAHLKLFFPAEHTLSFVASLYTDSPPWKNDKSIGDDHGYRTYNARDASLLLEIYPKIRQDLIDNKMLQLALDEMAAILPTVRVTLNGIAVNKNYATEVAKRLRNETQGMVDNLRKLTKRFDFNPRSTAQVAHLLFKDLKLKSSVHTKGGTALSTGKDVLVRLQMRYPDNEVLHELAAFRKLDKMISSFADPPIREDGRVHTVFKMNLVTGRNASEKPNMQNLPAKGSDQQGYIRQMYVGGPGKTLVALDLKQAELRVIATLANDIGMLQAFAAGVDIHKLNCIDLFGEYSDELRLFAKRFVFALNYGSEGFELKKHATAEILRRGSIDTLKVLWFQKHPALKRYWDEVSTQINKHKKIVNPFGRVRWYPERKITKEDLRTAINFPIQSCVADIMLRKTVAIDAALRDGELLVLPWHDAFWLELPSYANIQERVMEIKKIIDLPTIAQTGVMFDIPFDGSIGNNFYDMKKVA